MTVFLPEFFGRHEFRLRVALDADDMGSQSDRIGGPSGFTPSTVWCLEMSKINADG